MPEGLTADNADNAEQHFRRRAAVFMVAGPRARRASERVISLPMHLHLERADVFRVCEALRAVVRTRVS